MTDFADAKIDAAIMSGIGPFSLKAARVIFSVGEKFEDTSPSFLDRIAGRVAILVQTGDVKVAGNPANWRRSELWLTPPST